MALAFLQSVLLAAAFLTTMLVPPPAGKGAPPFNTPLPSKKLHQLSLQEIDAWIKTLSRTSLTLAEKIAVYSSLSLETPYLQGCLGEGSTGRFDRDPLIDFTRVDCTTFCEQTLALAISDDYQSTFRNLQKIRYHKGAIHFTARNHFILADWLPNNRWLLQDVTRERGGPRLREMVKTIDRRAFAASLGYGEAEGFLPPQIMKIDYLPTSHLTAITPRLGESEIMVVITTRPGIFAAHLGFIIKNGDGSLLLRHASQTSKKVIDEPLMQVAERLMADPEIAGVVFLHVRDDYRIPPEQVSDTLQ